MLFKIVLLNCLIRLKHLNCFKDGYGPNFRHFSRSARPRWLTNLFTQAQYYFFLFNIKTSTNIDLFTKLNAMD
ncbi:hypothetical protein QE152_g7475 [Popillia japonica]|uniref:Uncharacterized protein n=1 Tax=Popillia japonica TaxID=7064 RepID=A0AAW1MEG7_POPJA